MLFAFVFYQITQKMQAPAKEMIFLKMYSTSEAADVLKISVRTLKRWLKNGILKPVTTYDNGYNAYSEEQLKNFQKGMTHSEKNVVTRDTVFKPVTKNVTPFAKGMTKPVTKDETCDIETYDKKNNVIPSEHMTFPEISGVQSLGVQKDPCKNENCTGEIAQVEQKKGNTMVNLKPFITDEDVKAIAVLSKDARADLAAQINETSPFEIFDLVEGKTDEIICPVCGSGTHGNNNTGIKPKFKNGVWLYHCFAGNDLEGDLIKIIADANNLATNGADFFKVLAIAAKILGLNVFNCGTPARKPPTTSALMNAPKKETVFSRNIWNTRKQILNNHAATCAIFSILAKKINFVD